MKLHLAGAFPWGGEMYLKAVPPEEVNLLQSIVSLDEAFKKNARRFKSFMLDSGAFTFLASKGKAQVDWNAYIDGYVQIIKDTGADMFFELDIDPIVGYERVKEFRRTLERRTGKQPIPVWHKSRGKDEFIRMCDEYKYVSLGGIVTKEFKPSEYKYFSWFISEAHKRGCKIHGLGFTQLKLLGKYHFDSVDSSSWSGGVRFGKAYRYKDGKLVDVPKPTGARANGKQIAVHNYIEWVKFSKYAELHY